MKIAPFLDASFLNLHRRDMAHIVSKAPSKSQIWGRNPACLHSMTKALNDRYIQLGFSWFADYPISLMEKCQGYQYDFKKSGAQTQITHV